MNRGDRTFSVFLAVTWSHLWNLFDSSCFRFGNKAFCSAVNSFLNFLVDQQESNAAYHQHHADGQHPSDDSCRQEPDMGELACNLMYPFL